ncbi:hypothetical protein [Phenylobacterium sp.]|uniref:hypothetical protein n=1 Tax=Phenylobacterium sp. TaxID=1871053 RepID=UPI00301BCA89
MTLNKARFEAAFAKSAAGIDAQSELDPRVQELWILLEPALEERGVMEQEVRDHFRENTKDILSWRGARTFATSFAVFVVMVTMTTLGIVLFHDATTTRFTGLGSDSVRVAFLAGSFATIFGLTALIVRGAFSASHKDDGASLMPENAKVVVDTLGALLRAKT